MQDFLLDSDGDLGWANNDLIWGQSDSQHERLLLFSAKGMWKENPQVGVSPAQYLQGQDLSGLIREIREQYTADGMNVTSIGISESGQILVGGGYPA